LPNGTVVKADYTELLSANDLDRFTALEKADWMTDNEKRVREGLQPISGGAALPTDRPLAVVGGAAGG
jgi:phage portal protein BeeE